MNFDNSNVWTEKYKPKKVSELTTNSTAIKNIYSWLSSFDKSKKESLSIISNKKNKKTTTSSKDDSKQTNEKKKKKINNKSCLLVSGSHGVGKTITVEVILNELGYTIQLLDLNILKSVKNVEDVVNKIMLSSNILTIMNKSEKKKTAIVIDEIESFTSSTEKNHIIALQKLNDLNWYCPVIFISNNQHNKLLSDIKKGSCEVKLFPPYQPEMKKIVLRISQLENIKIKSDVVINKIICHSQGDIRRLIFTLQDIKYAYGDKPITQQIMDEYCLMSNRKDVDTELYKATEELLYNYKSIDDCLRLFETEKVLLPLMIHQNYPKNIISNYKDQEQCELIQKIAESLSIGDVIENYIYGDQNWEMQEIHGFYTCVATSYYSCSGIDDDPNKINVTFATDLNKTSIKKINKKNIINTDRCFKNMNTMDYIYINKIIRKFINEGNIKECINLLKNYDIKLEHIESLLKIDKIKNTKTSLTSKQRNEFINYLNLI